MILKRIEISNFKSFDHLAVDLNPLNVLVGANASGKSNFVQVFKFLRDIVDHGLENAVSLQGGVKYFRNVNLGANKEFKIKLFFDYCQEKRRNPVFKDSKTLEGIEILSSYGVYEFGLRFSKRDDRFKISKDSFTLTCEYTRYTPTESDSILERPGSGEFHFYISNQKLHYAFLKKNGDEIEEDVIPDIFQFNKASIEYIQSHQTLLELQTFIFHQFAFEPLIKNIDIYEFTPEKLKERTSLAGKLDLEEDGHNLALVLKNILDNPQSKNSFLNISSSLLPFIKDIKISKAFAKSLDFKMQEKFGPDKYLPASLLSDGTIYLTAMVVALYFNREKNTSLIFFEEPERYIHPSLIPRMMDMLNEVAESRPVFLVTHSPEILKHADLKNLMLISRNKAGFSAITRPLKNKVVSTFLEHEIGIDDLYTQNLLGG